MYDNTFNSQQFDFDTVKLASLGFQQNEINTLQYVLNNGGKVSTNALVSYGLNYEQAKRIRYMYDICTGKIAIDNSDDLVRHLRKMNSNIPRIGIQNLKVSTVNKVPRKAVVAGIKDPTYSIYNSAKYPLNKKLYDVVSVTNSRIHIKTPRKPVLKYKQSKSIEGVLEILGFNKDKQVVIAFDKKYCRLCNRFMVVASLRRPEKHLGLIEIICIEGTRVYVYAQNMGTKESVSYSMGTQRVYSWGVFPNEINGKLTKVGEQIYHRLNGVYSKMYPANTEYSILAPVQKKEDIDEIKD